MKNLKFRFSKAAIPAVLVAILFYGAQVQAQGPPEKEQVKMTPEMTESWEPEPEVVTSEPVSIAPPSDAIILFDGKNLDQWVSTNDPSSPARWTVADGTFTVKKGTGNIQTKRSFKDYQLHLEWMVPENITGEGQGRGNSGLFLASTGGGDAGYELQILDSYNNRTYSNGQSASIYKQYAPLVNSTGKPGEWNSYDIIFTAPRFKENGDLFSPAEVTVLQNGVVVQNDTELKGPTQYIGLPEYKQHDKAPIKLQDHGDPSEPLSFRNIWIREL